MSETWPTAFPAPSVQYTGKLASAVIRTKMETGRIRTRRRFTSQLRAYSVKWDMTDFQFGLFESWFLYKIGNGADFFNMALPTGGAALKTVLTRFQDGTYSNAYDGVLYWHVSATLEVENASVWTAEEYATHLAAGS